MPRSVNYMEEDLTTPLVPKCIAEKSGSTAEVSLFIPNQQQTDHFLTIESHQEKYTIPLEAATYSIGRHPANSIVLEEATISRHHALLLRIYDAETGQYFFRVTDGNLRGKRSLNGIVVNGNPCFSHDLKDQDVLSFGEDVKITYHKATNLATNLINGSDSSGISLGSLNAESDSIPLTHLINCKDTDAGHNPTSKALEEDDDSSNEAVLVRLSSFPELTPHPIIETDLKGNITYVNPAAVTQFPELSAPLSEDQDHVLLAGLYLMLEKGYRHYHVREVQVRERWYEQSIHCLPQSSIIRSYLVDITQRKHIEQGLRDSEDRYAAAARGANDGLWDWDLNTNEIYFSLRWKAMLGYPEKDISDDPEEWFNRIHTDDQERVRQELSEHLARDTPHFESDFRILHRDGQYRWFRCRGLAIYDENNHAIRIAGSQTDITDYYRAQEQLSHDALHDALTGLPNRVLLMDRLGHALEKSRRHQSKPCAVAFFDLDRFKLINDSLGHMIGDQLLIDVAHRLKACLRSIDTVARLGGDEFVILLDEVFDTEDAVHIIQRIQQELKKGFNLDGYEVFTDASIGIVISDSHYEYPEELLRDADTAMYHAKNLGRNCYAVFNENLRSHALASLKLENDLRRAIDRQEFKLVYQPIVSLMTKQILGFEALIRWHHPERGIVTPSAFIPAAEETGLIVPIDWWVLEEACRQMNDWQLQFIEAHLLSISVNISGCQFSQPDFVAHLTEFLHGANLKPSSLKLEITEGVIMDNATAVAKQLSDLKDLGIRLGIDDFGTGYSSLNYLSSFPVDTLKVDRSFVNRMENNDGLEIVKTIINLAHNLRMEVVAEGVETEVQARELQNLNCEYAQGYLFSKPLYPEDVRDLLIQAA